MIAGTVAYLVLTSLLEGSSGPDQNLPEAIREPRVVLGENFLAKATFVQDKKLGGITSIVYGELDPHLGPELCIVGHTGVLFTDEDGEWRHLITFGKQSVPLLGLKFESAINYRTGKIQVIDVDGDMNCEFFVRADSGKAELIDHKGKTSWLYNGGITRSPLADSIAGDLDGDGTVEYVAAHYGSKGLVMLDSSLNTIWEKPSVHVHRLELVDVDSDARKEIAYSRRSEVGLMDRDGNEVSKPVTRYDESLSLTRWPTATSPQLGVVLRSGKICLLDFDDKMRAQYVIPVSVRTSEAHCTPVKLRRDESEYLAALVELDLKNRSLFYVYDASRKLVYQEVLPGKYESIATVPDIGSATEAILLGGSDTVLRYTAVAASAGQPAADPAGGSDAATSAKKKR